MPCYIINDQKIEGIANLLLHYQIKVCKTILKYFLFKKMPFSIICVMLLKGLHSSYIILLDIIVCKNNEGIAFCKLYLL